MRLITEFCLSPQPKLFILNHIYFIDILEINYLPKMQINHIVRMGMGGTIWKNT